MIFLNKPYAISITLLAATLLAVILVGKRGMPVVVNTNLENIPMQIGAYQGTEKRFPDSVYAALNADHYVYRQYLNPNGTRVNLYIGYYGTAKGGRTGHNPYACLPSAGWGIIKTGTVSLDTGRGRAAVNYIVAQKGDVYENVLHWYQSDKIHVLSNGIEQNIQRFIGRIAHNRNDGAFIRISMLTPKDKLAQAKEDMRFFAEKLLIILPDYWPEEK